jgi:hypothetical protein
MDEIFIVVDIEGYISLGGENADEQESFPTFKEAEKRAAALAVLSPGNEVKIYRRVAHVIAEVGEPTTKQQDLLRTL